VSGLTVDLRYTWRRGEHVRYTPALVALLAAGCYTTRVDIRPALPPAAQPNSVVIERGRAEVWAKGIPALAKKFFVINNIDQSSGLVNVSYAGDPQRYVVGPVITYTVQTQGSVPSSGAPATDDDSTGAALRPAAADQGQGTVYTFPGTAAAVEYVQAEGQRAAKVSRTVRLEGRANVVLEAMGPTKTLVTVNVRYVLTAGWRWHSLGNWLAPPPESVTIAFNTGGKASFIEHEDAFYYPTGEFEAELLAVFR
jgi:hypothetical protein